MSLHVCLRPQHSPFLFSLRLRRDGERRSSSSSSSSRRLRIFSWSLGDRWKLIGDIDRDAVQERLSSWFVKARGVVIEVAAPIVNSSQGKSEGENENLGVGGVERDAVQERLGSWLAKARGVVNDVAAPIVNSAKGKSENVHKSEVETLGIEEAMKDFTASGFTVDRNTPKGVLSLAAVVSIEQFGRMNGLTGRKMHKIYEALAPEEIRYDARSVVEYGCFRYLSRDSSEIHPSLKDITFRRLIFITMLAWQKPYTKDGDSHSSILEKTLVEEEAFVRIAPAIAGIADKSTAHHLFKALVGNESGISLSLWNTYIAELLKVHQGRKSYKSQGDPQISTQEVICVRSSKKMPVLKWERDIARPGNLTLTDHALYFEGIGLAGSKQHIRLDLTKHGSRVEKAKVGPFRSKLFDSAVSISSDHDSKTWVLEFVDFGSESRRDVWFAFISEITSLYEFIREFGPLEGDPFIGNIYGAHKGTNRVVGSVANSIARLQSLQFFQKLSDDPAKLMQFSYLRTVPYGDVVLQALAVSFWGGPTFANQKHNKNQSGNLRRPSSGLSGDGAHVYDIDGSVYLRKWMRSPSWSSTSSSIFWRGVSVRKGIILGRNLVVADLDIVEKAALTCKLKSQLIEKTQASIDAAMINGIPSNIDLFKEIMLPFMVMAKHIEKLRRWEEPRLTLCFLVFTYTIIFRNLFVYVLPVSLMILATTLLLLRGLREQGRLGRCFGKVTIRDQPPSNTIQKLIAFKEAMADFESSLQNINVSLLKIRTIILSGQPEITKDVAVLLFCASAVLLIVPFRYIFSFLLFDLFTRELAFRKEMVEKFRSFIKEKWASVQAAPVVILPYEMEEPPFTEHKVVNNIKRRETIERVKNKKNNTKK